jgi:cytochrome c biogenesis protein CcmG/thiol:disulfide interchange protein DsbE
VRRPIVSLAVLALVAVACSSPSSSSDPLGHPAVRSVTGAMPAVEGSTLEGGMISPSDYAGRPVVVNFWATWCAPCERELPLLAGIAHREGSRVAFIGVDYKDQDGPARGWISRYGVPYTNVADPDGHLANAFGVSVGLPTTFVVDATGELRYRVMGELRPGTLEALLARLEASRSAPT